jgi:hypothetical protein
MKNIDFKALVPHLLVIIVLAILSAVYFSPELEGKRLDQSDIAQFKGMSKEIVDYRDKTGEEPLWTNSMFGGMPAYQISVIHPAPVLGPIDTIMKLGSRGGLGKHFLNALGFYLLMLALKLDWRIAALGAVAYGFSSYLIVILEVGHNSKAVALGYAPAVLAGFIMLFRNRQYLWGTVVTALFLGLQIKSNHPQITYYFLILMICLGLFFLIDAARKGEMLPLLKSLGLFAGASLIAIGLSAPRLLSTAEYLPWTTRGTSELAPLEGEKKTEGLDLNYATNWSYGISESMTLLVPNYMGGTNGHPISKYNERLEGVRPANKSAFQQLDTLFWSYWGAQPSTSGPVYAGALIVLLALVGFWYVEGPLKWGLLAGTILGLMMAWGRNFMPFTEFLFEYVPGYNKFRAVSMALVIVGATLPIMAALGLEALVKRREEIAKKMTGLYAIGGGLAVLLLLMYITPTTFVDFMSDSYVQKVTPYLQQYNVPQPQINSLLADVEAAREPVFKSDISRTLMIILIGFGLIWAFMKEKISATPFILGLAVITLFDLWTVDRRYLDDDKFANARDVAIPFRASSADKTILKDKDPYFRVFNSTVRVDTDGATSYFHKNIGGYHAAKSARFEELLYRQVFKGNLELINMLNTKYIIQETNNPDPAKRKLVAVSNPDVSGNAWFIERAQIVANADAEMAALTDLDWRNVALVDKRFEENINANTWQVDANASIALTSYAPNAMTFKSKRSSDGFAVFSDVYYQPGWDVTIDGEVAEHIRVNYVLRGMEIPAGEHDIVFSFNPPSIARGNTIAYTSSGLLVLLILGATYWEFRAPKKENA